MIKKYLMLHAPLEVALFIIENFNELRKPQFDFINLINNKIQKL